MPTIGLPEYLLFGSILLIAFAGRITFLYLQGYFSGGKFRYRFIVEDKRFHKFIVEVRAGDGRGAQMQAAEIGKTLGLLLTGPI